MPYFFQKLYKRLKNVNVFFLIGCTILYFTIASFGIFLIEPSTYKHPFDGLWWTYITASTTGYGDLFPTSIGGRLFTMFYVFPIGGIVIGAWLAKLSKLVEMIKNAREEGKMTYRGKNHIVFINYAGKKTNDVFEEVQLFNKKTEVVLIDELEKRPINDEDFYFINGDPTDEKILEKANLLQAQRVVIFVPNTIIDERLADGNTLLIAKAIELYGKKNGKNIYTIVEILNEKRIDVFLDAKVEEYIVSGQGIVGLLSKATTNPGSSKLFTELLSKDKRHGEYDIYEIKQKTEWKTYKEAKEWLEHKNITLLAINNQMNVYEKLNEEFKPNDVLSVVCKEDDYNKIR